MNGSCKEMIRCLIKEVTSVTLGVDTPELCQNICQVDNVYIFLDFFWFVISLPSQQPGMPSGKFFRHWDSNNFYRFLGSGAGQNVNSLIFRQILHALPSLGPRSPFLSTP